MSKSLETSNCPLELDSPPDGWEVVRVGDTLEDVQSGFACGQRFHTLDGVPHLRPMNVSPGGEIDLDDLRLVPEDFNGRRLRRDDVLFNNTNSPAWVGKTALVRSDADLAFSNHMTRLRGGEKVEPAFLASQLHYLCTAGYFLHQCKKHVNQASISSGFLTKRTPFLLPPLPEQRRIVARLDAIEAHRCAAKEKLDQLPDLLDRYRQSVLAAAFRGDLTAAWREAHPDAEPVDSAVRSLYRERWIANRAQTLTDRAEARDAKKGNVWTDATRSRRFKTETAKAEKTFALPDSVQAEDHPGLPEGWSWMTLEEIVDPARGLCYGVVQPGKDPGEGVPLIRVQDLLGEHIDRESLRRIEPAIDDQYERSRVEPGDVLVSLVGTIGRVATVDAEVGYANIARAVGRVSSLCGLGEWIALCLQAPQVQDWLQRESREVARKTLNLGTLAQAAIPVPPLAEAAQAVSQATAYLQRGRAIMATAQVATERVENLRQSTLARAFRGELVPTDAALARSTPPAVSRPGRGEAQSALDL